MKTENMNFNGFVLVAFNGDHVSDSHLFTMEYDMPFAALSCELADQCKDYEKPGSVEE